MFKSLFVKNQARRFSFTPYYYDPGKDEEQEQAPRPRIQFRRLRHRPEASSRSLRMKVVLAIILLFLSYFFNDMVRENQSKFKVESIKIDVTGE